MTVWTERRGTIMQIKWTKIISYFSLVLRHIDFYAAVLRWLSVSAVNC